MPKIKTKRAAAKRFRKTASGRIKRTQGNKQHILTKKSPKRIRDLRGMVMVSSADEKQIHLMLPNG
jgi:large subunit ribosomal protein L35